MSSDDGLQSQSDIMETRSFVTNQLDTRLNLKVKSFRKVNINLSHDKVTPRVSSCAFLPNGELLLADHENCSVKLLDKTFSVKNSFDFITSQAVGHVGGQ